MSTSRVARQVTPFEFRRVALLVEVTPCRAASVAKLLTGVTLAPDSSIFFHLHRQFFRDADQASEYPNDFANWAGTMLGDSVLGERLANLNLVRTRDLATIRREISVILAERLQQAGDTKTVRPGLEFIFCQPLMVEFGNGCQASTVTEFVECLRELPSDSIGYPLFAPFTGAEAAAFRMRQLLTHPRLARRMGEQGHQHVRRHFLITRHARDHLVLMHAVLDGGRSRLIRLPAMQAEDTARAS